jgi:hypothetical protein
LRAGLLSEPGIVKGINERFVPTWALIDDLKQSAEQGNRFAGTLFNNWEYPLDLMFLTAEGEYVSKLNSFRDLPNAHPDVGHPGNPLMRHGLRHADVFFRHAKRFVEDQRTRRVSPHWPALRQAQTDLRD